MAIITPYAHFELEFQTDDKGYVLGEGGRFDDRFMCPATLVADSINGLANWLVCSGSASVLCTVVARTASLVRQLQSTLTRNPSTNFRSPFILFSDQVDILQMTALMRDSKQKTLLGFMTKDLSSISKDHAQRIIGTLSIAPDCGRAPLLLSPSPHWPSRIKLSTFTFFIHSIHFSHKLIFSGSRCRNANDTVGRSHAVRGWFVLREQK